MCSRRFDINHGVDPEDVFPHPPPGKAGLRYFQRCWQGEPGTKLPHFVDLDKWYNGIITSITAGISANAASQVPSTSVSTPPATGISSNVASTAGELNMSTWE
jgi:hypothetical protein